MQPDTIDNALDSTSIDEIDAAIAAQTDAATDAAQAAEEADAAALDPRATAADAAKRRKVAEDARFASRRAQAALESLRGHREATAEAQAEAAARAAYEAAVGRYVAALDSMESEWDEAVGKLATMAQEHESAFSEMQRTRRDDYEGVADERARDAVRALQDMNINRLGGTPAVSSNGGVTLRFYG